MLLGNGDGSFQWEFDYTLDFGSISIAVGEFNGDGIQDLVIDRYDGVRVLLGNGNGTFRAPLIFDAGGRAVSLAVGDFNRDQIPDLATANNSVPGISVLLGNGNGTFGMPSNIDVGAGPNGTDGIGVGDFNSDGIHDLLVTHVRSFSSGVPATGFISVLLGTGNGMFQAAANFLIGGG